VGLGARLVNRLVTDPRREVEKLEQAIGIAIENIAAKTTSEADRDEPDDDEITPPVPSVLVVTGNLSSQQA